MEVNIIIEICCFRFADDTGTEFQNKVVLLEFKGRQDRVRRPHGNTKRPGAGGFHRLVFTYLQHTQFIRVI